MCRNSAETDFRMWRVKKVRVCKIMFFPAWFWAFEMKKIYIDIYLKEKNYVYSAKLELGTKYDFLVLLTVKFYLQMFENYGFQMQALTILMQIKGYLLCNFKIFDCWKIGRIISESCPILVWILKSFLHIVSKEWFSQIKHSTQNWFARVFFLLISDTIQTIKLQIFSHFWSQNHVLIMKT